MKPTNDSVKVELQHLITGDMIAWRHCGHYVPAHAFLDDRIELLRGKHNELIEANKLPTNDEGLVEYSKVTDEGLVAQLADINRKVLVLQMDQLCCIMEPVEALPAGKNKRELLEECIGSYEIIAQITLFFSVHSARSISSRADGTALIRFQKANGETFNPFPRAKENGSAKENSSTG